MQIINEEIKINDTLNPDLWEDNELKEDVKEKLLDIADNFLDALKEDGINIDVEDIRFLGSNANYNYTDKSDIDLHIVVNLDNVEAKNIMTLLLSAYKTLFNQKFNITINGHEVEIYVEDVNQPAKSNGVYSLYTGWIKEPNKSTIPNIDWEEFEKQFDEWEDKYFDIVGEHSNSELEESLLEGKQDKENFKKWAEQTVDLAYKHSGLSDWEKKGNVEYIVNWFEDNRKNLKSPQNDYYYWIKYENPEVAYKELNRLAVEDSKKKQSKQKEKDGAKLIYDKDGWKVYEITTYEASCKYGQNTKWCISGSKRWGNGESGLKHWDSYVEEGVKFYFFINGNTKYALALYPNNKDFELFDELDNSIAYIPNAPKLDEIPVDYTSIDDGRTFKNLVFTGKLPHLFPLMCILGYNYDGICEIFTKDEFNDFLDCVREQICEEFVTWQAVESGVKDEEWYEEQTGEEWDDDWGGDYGNLDPEEIGDITYGYATLDEALTKDNPHFNYDTAEYFVVMNGEWTSNTGGVDDFLGLFMLFNNIFDVDNDKFLADLHGVLKDEIKQGRYDIEEYTSLGLSKDFIMGNYNLEENLLVESKNNYNIKVYRVGEDEKEYKNSTRFYASSLDYFDYSDTGYDKNDAKPYLLNLTDFKVWNPIKELKLNVNSWSHIEGRIKDFEKYNIYYLDYDDVDEDFEFGYVCTDDLADAGRKLGYDVTILENIPSNHGWGDNFTEYAVHNSNAIKSINATKFDKNSANINEAYANNIDKDILDTIKNPLEKLYKNTKCSKSAGTLLDKYFYETDKPLKLCLGNVVPKGDKTKSNSIHHVWIEVDGKVKETNFPSGDYERVLIDSLDLDRNEDLYNQVEEFLNKSSLREDLSQEIDSTNINESFLISNSDIFVTESVYEVKNKILNTKKPIRILFDYIENIYLICNEYDYTHTNMIEYAMKDGYFQVDEYGNKINNAEDYLDGGSWETWRFIPKGYSVDLGEDGYYYRFNYDFGSLMSRADDFEDYNLCSILGEPISVEGFDDDYNEGLNEELSEITMSPFEITEKDLAHIFEVASGVFWDKETLCDNIWEHLEERCKPYINDFYVSYSSGIFKYKGQKLFKIEYSHEGRNAWAIYKLNTFNNKNLQPTYLSGELTDLVDKYVLNESLQEDLELTKDVQKLIDKLKEYNIELVGGKELYNEFSLTLRNKDNNVIRKIKVAKNIKTIKSYCKYLKDYFDNLQEDYDYNKVYQIKELYKKSYDELIDNSTRLYRYREWASNSNNDYKEYIYNDLKNNKKDSALNLWYNHYRLKTGDYDLSYEDFLNTPITLYRATNVNEDEDSNNPFFSYAQNKRDAERFLSQVQNLYGNRSGEIKEIQIKPKDTLGMLPSDENEIIVPNNSYQKRITNIENIVNEVIDYANKNNVELPYDKDELLDSFKKEGRDTESFRKHILDWIDKRKGKLKEDLDYGYHAGDLGKSEDRQQQDGGRGTGHFGTGTYFVSNEDKIKNYNDYQYGKGKAPHHIVDFSKYHLYTPSNNDKGYDLHDTLKLLNNGYKYFTTHKDDLEWFKSHNLTARRSGEFEGKDIPEIVKHLNNLLGEYDPIELPKDINYSTIDQEEDEVWDKYYDELKPQYKDKGTGAFFDAIEDKINEDPKFVEYRSLIKMIREAIEEEIDDRTLSRLTDYTNLVDKLYNALEGRHSKEEIETALNEVNDNLYSKTGDSLSTIFMKALGYEGIDVRHLQDNGDTSGLDNTTYGSVIYDLKPDTIVEDIDKIKLGSYNLYEELENLDKIEFFEDEQIGCPVEEFLNSIEDKKLKAKTIRNIEVLNEKGSELTKPLVDYVDDGIYELRTQQSNNITRIFYFFIFGGKIIMTNGYIKKTQKLNKDEFAKAKKYRDIYSRKKVGEK